MKSNAAS
jgi:hypothetical protein